MNSDLPKVLHKLGGAAAPRPCARRGRRARARAHRRGDRPRRRGGRAAAREIDPSASAHQEEQLGTAHAVLQAARRSTGFAGDAVVLYGDTPFVRPETLDAMREARRRGHAVSCWASRRPTRRLRPARDRADGRSADRRGQGRDTRRTRDNPLQFRRDRGRCGAAVRPSRAGRQRQRQGRILPHRHRRPRPRRGLSAAAITCPRPRRSASTPAPTSPPPRRLPGPRPRRGAGERRDADRARDVFFAFDTVIGRDAVIEPNVVFGPGVTVETGATIHAFCHLEGCHVSRGRQSSAPSPACARRGTRRGRARRQLRRGQERHRSARAPRSTTSPTSATPRSARAPTSARAPSPATTTAS
jgi:bifunctional UDP-N-acetylglucosamine pyrophosphorylase / glucosamine-1-phosphate N-acetyltransferase